MVKLDMNYPDHDQMDRVAHTPVMSQEVLEYLKIPDGGCFVDCTLGLGGHSRLLLEAAGSNVRMIGIDRDNASVERARQNLAPFVSQCTFVHDDFRNLERILETLHVRKVDGILFDLGISSYQLNNPERGFSIQLDGPLDMRMNQENWISAYDLINSLSEREISLILKNYGEERWHGRIARYLVARRTEKPIQSTHELSEVVLRAMPSRQRHQKIHPATRTFQAFRIAVNRELEAIETALDQCPGVLAPGGKVCAIAFHSLEDRIVKHKFRALARKGIFELPVKKPLRPEEGEVHDNPRARSARLRVAVRHSAASSSAFGFGSSGQD